MKTLLITALLVFSSVLKAQQLPPHSQVKMKTYKQPALLPGNKSFKLYFDFAENGFRDTTGIFRLKNTTIQSIDYVYSACSDTSAFVQEQLDRKRCKALKKILPEAFKNPYTNWRFIEQRVPLNDSDKTKLFHGFVIQYRAVPSAASMKSEIAYMKNMLGRDTVIKPANAEHAFRLKYPGYSFISASALTDSTWKVIGRSNITNSYIDVSIKLDSIKIWTDPPKSCMMNFSMMGDSVVKAVFRRNKDWEKMLILCDVTSSMAPYSAQLFAWYKLNALEKRVDQFIFFNDGNFMADQDKVAGKVGGIYSIQAVGFDSVMSAAHTAMTNGYGGGDLPENNIEALLYGQLKFPETKDIVMIADNFATPRDLKFADSINRPVHIIMCGTNWGGNTFINVEYLELARKTGGTIHTIESDITNLATMHEGDTVKIGKQFFRLRGGKFVPELKT